MDAILSELNRKIALVLSERHGQKINLDPETLDPTRAEWLALWGSIQRALGPEFSVPPPIAVHGRHVVIVVWTACEAAAVIHFEPVRQILHSASFALYWSGS